MISTPPSGSGATRRSRPTCWACAALATTGEKRTVTSAVVAAWRTPLTEFAPYASRLKSAGRSKVWGVIAISETLSTAKTRMSVRVWS